MKTRYIYQGNHSFLEGVEYRLKAAGFSPVDEPAAADIALTFCTSQTQLEEIYFGDDGLASIMEEGSLLVDMSAITPNFARDLNSICTINNLYMVEAPMVVADMVAEPVFDKDNLICFVAGEDEAIKQAQKLLKTIFGTMMSIGRPGAAQLARCGRTMQTAAQVISAIEAQALYRAARHSVGGSGLGKLNVEATSIAGSNILRAIREKQFGSGYSVEMLMAELVSALMAADDAELILPQTEAAMHLLELLAVIGGSDLSPAALSVVYGDESDGESLGLDWSRAEQTYGGNNQAEEEFDLNGVFGHLHSDGEDLDEFDDLDGYNGLDDYDPSYNSDYDDGYNNTGYEDLDEEFH